MPEEKLYVINLSRLYWTGRAGRAARAMRAIRRFLERHTKAARIILDESINEYVFSRAYDRPPRRVVVRVIPVDKEGRVLKAVLAIPLAPAAAGEGKTEGAEKG